MLAPGALTPHNHCGWLGLALAVGEEACVLTGKGGRGGQVCPYLGSLLFWGPQGSTNEALNFQANSLWGRVREEEPVPGAPAWNCCAHRRCWPCVDQTIRCGGGVGSSPLPSGAPTDCLSPSVKIASRVHLPILPSKRPRRIPASSVGEEI